MPIPFLNSINLTKNQVENFCIYNVANDPTGSLTVAGDYGYFWLNTTNSGGTIPTLKWWDGTNVRSLVDSTNIGSFTSGLATDLAGGGAGQIVYQDGANDTKFLAAGNTGQVLSSNGASAPSWLNQSSLSAGTAANISGGLAGQLLYQSALATTAKLTIGTAGQALVVNAGATAPEWVDQSTFSVGSATNKPGGNLGDILVQSGSGTTGFLNVGTTGQVITSNGASPQYVNQSTLSVGSATTSGTATNIAGGAANRIPYQTAAGTTAFITDAANSILTTNASSVPALTAATNVTVGKAVDIALGAAGDLLYQSASNDTSFLNIGANGSILTSTGTAPQWSASIPSGSVSGLAASATTDTTDAGNISSGTLGLARLALATGQFYVGDASNNPAATLKSSIPLSGFGAAGADVAMGGYKLTGLGAPTASTDAATMGYVDSVAQGLDVKASCLVASTADITLSSPGAISIDNIPSTSFTAGTTRILVRAQNTASQNGIYIWNGSSSAMTRSADADTWDELVGAFTFIEQGDTLKDTGWVCTVDAGTLGTTAVTWSQFSGAGSYTANRGLVLSGSAFNFAQNSDYAIGDLPYATGQTTIGLLPAVATGNALISGGVATAPSWGKIGLTTHVSGTLPIANGGTGATSFTQGHVLFAGASTISSSANLFWDNSNNRLGIGTPTPAATVSIKQTGAQMDVSTSATDVTFEAIDRAATTNAINTRWYTRNGEFQWNNSSYSRAMTLDSLGRLGIGTATPAANLHVNADNASTISSILAKMGGGDQEFKLVARNGDGGAVGNVESVRFGLERVGVWNSGIRFFRGGAGNDGYLLFSTSGQDRLTIASDGVCTWSNVGGVAGTAMTLNGTGLGVGVSPATKLHIAGTGNQELKIQTNTSGNPILTLAAAGQDGASILYNRTDNYLSVNISAITGALRLTTSGNLGLGVTPSARLHTYISDGGTNNLVEIARLQRATTGTAAVGFGQYLRFDLERGDGANEVAGFIGTKWSNATAGVTKGDLIFGGSDNGAVTATMTLDANGKLLFSANGTASAPTIANADNPDTGLYWPTDADTLALAVGGSDAVYIDANRRVGIGTPTPNAGLVISSSGAQGFEFSPNAAGVAQLETYNRSTAAYFSLRINSDDLRICTGSSATERLRIKSTGQLNFTGLAADPTGAAGDVYYNSTAKALKLYATDWKTLPRKAVVQGGAGTGTTIAVAHNLNTNNVSVTVLRTTDNVVVFTDVAITDADTVTITFASSVTKADYTITVIG